MSPGEVLRKRKLDPRFPEKKAGPEVPGKGNWIRVSRKIESWARASIQDAKTGTTYVSIRASPYRTCRSQETAAAAKRNEQKIYPTVAEDASGDTFRAQEDCSMEDRCSLQDKSVEIPHAFREDDSSHAPAVAADSAPGCRGAARGAAGGAASSAKTSQLLARLLDSRRAPGPLWLRPASRASLRGPSLNAMAG